MGEESWEGIPVSWESLSLVPLSLLPQTYTHPAPRYGPNFKTWCIDLHWEQPMSKDDPLKIYHILGSRWLYVSGG